MCTVTVWKCTFLSSSFTSSQSAVSTLTAALVWSDRLSLRNHKSSVVSETMAVSMSCWRRNERDHLELRVSAAGVPALQPRPVNTSPFFLTNSLLSPGQLLQSPLGEKGTDHYSQINHPFFGSSTVLVPLASWPYSSWPPRYHHLRCVTTFNPEEGQLLQYNQCSGVQKDLRWITECLVYLTTLKVTNHLMWKAGTGTQKGEAESPEGMWEGKRRNTNLLFTWNTKEERKRIQFTSLKCLHTWLVWISVDPLLLDL